MFRRVPTVLLAIFLSVACSSASAQKNFTLAKLSLTMTYSQAQAALGTSYHYVPQHNFVDIDGHDFVAYSNEDVYVMLFVHDSLASWSYFHPFPKGREPLTSTVLQSVIDKIGPDAHLPGDVPGIDRWLWDANGHRCTSSSCGGAMDCSGIGRSDTGDAKYRGVPNFPINANMAVLTPLRPYGPVCGVSVALQTASVDGVASFVVMSVTDDHVNHLLALANDAMKKKEADATLNKAKQNGSPF